MSNSENNSGAEAPRTFGQRVRRTTLRIALIVLALFIGWVLFLYYAAYSEGSRAGMVIKLSKRGVVFKTWEGQLNLQTFGAVTPNGNALNEVFNFSVGTGEDSLYRVLEEASLSGERVNLHYVERYARLPWRGETKYFITSVERSGKAAVEQKQPTEH
ncbi:MAG: 6-phosphogluconate dehydrogenase [Flavobacteriales bacterium]